MRHTRVAIPFLLCALVAVGLSIGARRSSACKPDSLFFPAVFRASGDSPFGIASADFNGDSFPDVVVANPGSHNVTVFLGQGGGLFSPPSPFPVGSLPGSVAIADFDRDGILDLVCSDGDINQSAIRVLRGLGTGGHWNGSFAPPVSYASGLQVYRVAVGDLNGDGYPDVVATFFGSNTVGVYLNRGDGTFLPFVPYPVGAAPYDVTLADFNSDGSLDIAVGNQNSNNVSVLLGHGDGTFAPATNYPVSGHPYCVRAGDFNSDGIQDLAVAEGDAGSVRILFGNGIPGHGDGTFSPGPRYFVSAAIPTSIAIADYNGDGILDLAVASGGNLVEVLLGQGSGGTGNGTFSAPYSYFSGAAPWAIIAADFNRDGLPDLANVDYQGGGFSVLLSRCGTLTPPPPPCPGGSLFAPALTAPSGAIPFGIATADFNHDQIPDLAVGDAGTNKVSILLGKGGGAFNPPVEYPAGDGPHSVCVADFNNDGILDLAIADGNQGANSVAVLLGNGAGGIGNGTFGPMQLFPAGSKPYTVASGDFDGDGNIDLAVADFDDSAVAILRGNGDGTFGGPHYYQVGYRAYGLLVIDLNADGQLDLCVGSQDDHNLAILMGHGDGSFGPAVKYQALGPVYSIAAGDFDGDGIPDLAITNGGTPTIGVLRGLGGGLFAPEVNYMLHGPGPAGIAAADFNHDGTLDLAVSNTSTDLVDVLIGLQESGHSDGKFSSPMEFPVGPYPSGLVVADLDRDGTPDVAVADYRGIGVSLLIGGCRLVTAVAVSELAAVATSRDVILRWGSDVRDARQFEVWRSSGPDAAYQKLVGLAIGQTDGSYQFRDATAQPGASYFYKVGYRSQSSLEFFGPLLVTTPAAMFSLDGPSSNPVRSQCVIQFELDRPGPVRLEVFNSGGRRVRTLISEFRGAGPGSANWDGRGSSGVVPAGVYFLRLSEGPRTASRKILFLP